MIYFFGILVLIRLSYWFFLFTRLASYKPIYNLEHTKNGVSILVCVKNNIEGLKRLLAKIEKQNYDKFEVVIVDDFSDSPIIQFLNTSDFRVPIKITSPNENIMGKKAAVLRGLEVSSYDWILQTDSDCMPTSLNWIKWMMASRKMETSIVLGVSPLKSNASWISSIAAYESMYVAMQYLSYALKKMPYMGVGRNILFNKIDFFNCDPYKDNMEVASGDDDFLVQKIANHSNTQICIHHDAMTLSEAPQSIEKYISQKTRHVSTSPQYKEIHKVLLAVFSASHLGVYLFVILASIFMFAQFKMILSIYWVMVCIMLLIQYPIFYKFKKAGLIFILPFADIVLSLLYLSLIPSLFNKKQKQQWT